MKNSRVIDMPFIYLSLILPVIILASGCQPSESKPLPDNQDVVRQKLEKQIHVTKKIQNYLENFDDILKAEVILGQASPERKQVFLKITVAKPLSPNLVAQIKKEVGQNVSAFSDDITIFQRRLKISKP